MGLFGTTTKKRDIGGNGNARVQVMGTGCRKCHALYEAATEALGADQVDYVTDMARIAEAGVMTTRPSSWTARSSARARSSRPMRCAPSSGNGRERRQSARRIHLHA